MARPAPWTFEGPGTLSAMLGLLVRTHSLFYGILNCVSSGNNSVLGIRINRTLRYGRICHFTNGNVGRHVANHRGLQIDTTHYPKQGDPATLRVYGSVVHPRRGSPQGMSRPTIYGVALVMGSGSPPPKIYICVRRISVCKYT